MNSELELLKRVKTNTLEKIIDKHGTGFGNMDKMYLSIIDVKDILYKQIDSEAKAIIEEENRKALKEFSL